MKWSLMSVNQLKSLCCLTCVKLIYDLCAFREVVRKVARIIALALDLEADFFDRPEMLDEPIAILRLLHYEGGL